MLKVIALLAFFCTPLLQAQGFTTVGPSSTDCSQNYVEHVHGAMEELGVYSEAEMPPHFTEAEVESLLDVIEGEDPSDMPALLQGFFLHKNSIRSDTDFYDNQRHRVMDLIHELGIPDHKVAGLPLHFTADEYQSMVDMTQGTDYDQALLLIRGFVSHKVQNPINEVCIPGGGPVMGDTSSASGFEQPAYDAGASQDHLMAPASSSQNSLYFKQFPTIRKIW